MADQSLIDPHKKHLTLINTFKVKPERADALMDVLVSATRTVMRRQPGFVSANFHINEARDTIINYAQWTDEQSFEAMLASVEARPHITQAAELAESFEPKTYAVVFSDSVDDGD